MSKTTFKTIIFSSLALLMLSACTEKEETSKEKSTVIDHKIDAVNEAKKSVAAMNTKTQAVSTVSTVPAQAPNASNIYAKRCASCHGMNAEKSALNASDNIAQWDAKRIEDALQGYKNGTFGGKMKGMMQAQSKSLTDEEIKLLSDYISTL